MNIHKIVIVAAIVSTLYTLLVGCTRTPAATGNGEIISHFYSCDSSIFIPLDSGSDALRTRKTTQFCLLLVELHATATIPFHFFSLPNVRAPDASASVRDRAGMDVLGKEFVFVPLTQRMNRRPNTINFNEFLFAFPKRQRERETCETVVTWCCLRVHTRLLWLTGDDHSRWINWNNFLYLLTVSLGWAHR